MALASRSLKASISFLTSFSQVVMATLISLVEAKLSSSKTSETAVLTVSRIEGEGCTVRVADPAGERGGSGRAFSKRVAACDDSDSDLELLSVTRGGSSTSFLCSNRGTRALRFGTLFTTLLRVSLTSGVS